MSQQVGTATLAQRFGLNVFLMRQTRYPRLSQQELAEKSGLAVNTIINVESNRDITKPGVAIRTDTIEAIAKALDVGALDLLTDPFADDWPTRVYTEGLVQTSDGELLIDMTKVPAA